MTGMSDQSSLAALSAEGASLAQLVQAGLDIRKADSGERLLLRYVINNGAIKERNIPSVTRLFQTVVDLGHIIRPMELKEPAYDRDVLELGCGATLHGVGFRALGARSYTGIDKGIDPTRKRLRSRILKKSVGTQFSLSDAVRLIPGVSYIRGEGVSSNEAYDLALLSSATYSDQDLERTFSQLHRALRRGGDLWFTHQNFYSWSGHNGGPKHIGAYDCNNEEHKINMDWGHTLFSPPPEHRFSTEFNRIRLPELRQIVDRYFEVIQWTPTMEKAAIRERMKPVLRKKLSGFSEVELMTKSVVCYARRRG